MRFMVEQRGLDTESLPVCSTLTSRLLPAQRAHFLGLVAERQQASLPQSSVLLTANTLASRLRGSPDLNRATPSGNSRFVDLHKGGLLT
eukprot:1149922-Pelagomonas_calceolata.AAC.1